MQNNKQIIEDFLNGFLRGIRFRWHRKVKRAMDPSFITYQVTNRCNARCKMCNIWEKGKKEEELSLKEIERLSSDPIFRKLRLVNLTGGEPFIREDLPDIAEIIICSAPNLGELSFSTNGYFTEKIVRDIDSILKRTKPRIRITVGVSIDGFEELHDEIRGIKGIFKRAVDTVKELKNLDSQRVQLHVRTTITPYNVEYIDQIYFTLKEITKDVAFNLTVISSNYYANVDSANLLRLSNMEKNRVITFCEELILKEPKRAYYLDTIKEICKSGRRNMPCTGGYAMVYIAANGDVFPCNIVPDSFLMGNVRQEHLSDIWFSEKSNQIRKKLSSYAYCKRCEDNCDYATIVREDFYDFLLFMLSNPRILCRLVKAYGMKKM